MERLAPRVLIVDYSIDVRNLVAGLITRLFPQSQPIPLATARHAMRELDERPVDLLITDHHWPDQSGLELAQYARATGHAMPILVLTAHAEFEDDVWAVGVTATLAKPVRLRPLRSLILSLVMPKE